MISNFIIGLAVFCFDVIIGFIRGVFAFIAHVLGWPVILAAVVIVWALWRFGFI
ncbi:hypothetical protein HYT05_04300 [Candidatus Kaiserbacteria bacterium]|nr:hypothetical protein [Candidatus Kaiserbacteria bacterium]